MKKILIITSYTYPHIRIECEVQALSTKYEVHIACIAKEGQQFEEKLDNCTIHRKQLPKFIYKSSVGALKFPFYFNFWRKFTKQLFENETFDVVHIIDLPLAQIGYELKQKYNVEFVLDLFENWPVLLQLSQHTNTFLGKLLSSNKQWIKYEKDMCKKADNIIVVVEEAKERVKSLGIDKSKIEVVSNTLNLNQFDVVERTKFNNEDFRLLYVGGINYHRGIQYVIEAISILKNNGINVYFDLVGDGRYLSDLKKQIHDKNLENNIVIYGYKNLTDIKYLYESASLAVIPHIKSGHTDNTIPHKIFQYIYAQIPLAVSNCNPLVRIIEETHSGVSYHYDKPEELAAIIEDFYNKPQKLNEYIIDGRDSIINRYNWKYDGERLLKMYENL